MKKTIKVDEKFHRTLARLEDRKSNADEHLKFATQQFTNYIIEHIVKPSGFTPPAGKNGRLNINYNSEKQQVDVEFIEEIQVAQSIPHNLNGNGKMHN